MVTSVKHRESREFLKLVYAEPRFAFASRKGWFRKHPASQQRPSHSYSSARKGCDRRTSPSSFSSFKFLLHSLWHEVLYFADGFYYLVTLVSNSFYSLGYTLHNLEAQTACSRVEKKTREKCFFYLRCVTFMSMLIV